MEFENKRIMFFDLETTGIYWNYDAPVQIAAIIEENKQIVDTYKTLVKTNVHISPQASEVHGIYAKDLVDAPTEKDALLDFIGWILGNEVDIMVGYNSKTFDLKVLSSRCEHFGLKNIFDGERIKHLDGYHDRVKLAKNKNLYNLKSLGRRWNLSAVAELLGISSENAHDAMADVEMLRQIWHKFDNLL